LLNKFQAMYKLLIASLLAGSLLSCTGQTNGKNKNAANSKGTSNNKQISNMQEGKDYIILKRFRVVDNQLFNQPVEATSFLLPANWQVNGALHWDITKKCLPEILQGSVQAQSPDREYEFTMFPATQFDWSTDPVYLDAMQRGFNLHSCNISRPLDAAGYISQSIAPYMKAQVKSAKTITDLQQMMDAGAMQMTNAARQGGNTAYSHRGSAAEGILKFADGKEGLVFCTVMQTILTMPGTQGNMAQNYQCYVSMRMVLKYKAGNEAMARKIMSTLFSSTRINPQWSTAVQKIFADISRNAQIEIGQRIEIARRAQEEIGNNILRNWEAINSRGSGSGSSSNTDANSDGFGKYLRGVDSWTDEGGNKVELTSGYSNAWSKGDGSYIMSNNPAFDPNVELGGTQSWGRLKQ
jgi:hypothetical protein